MASDDEDDYCFYGTPIEEEQETGRGQHRKEVKDQASTRALPIWKQEVTDEQGRRRFHGAFTGGFSAGYYNTVGSAEGWAPSSFKSSRGQRWSGEKQQSVEQYLDEDELEELRRTNLQTTEQYDTFGGTAAELARRAAQDEARSRPSAIPGLLPDELVAPVAESVGVRLLQRMGWRQGKGVGTGSGAAEEEDGGGGGGGSRRRGWSQHAGVGAENTQLYLLAPKTDTFGLGFDPFKGAEEFRQAKQERRGAGPGAGRGRGQAGAGAKRQRGIAFGTGVMDEDDAYGIMEDYVTHDDVHSYADTVDDSGLPMSRGPKVAKRGLGDRLQRGGYSFEVQEDEEEDGGGLLRGGRPQHQYRLPSTAEPQLALQGRGGGFIPGFVRASAPPTPPPFFPPPRVPKGYTPQPPTLTKHQQQQQQSGVGPPPSEAQPPADTALKQEIDSMAFYVAKNGAPFEGMARQRAAREGGASGRHGFLLGGAGAGYYQWKVHAFKRMIQPNQPAIGQRSAPLSYEERGAMLGEVPLPGTAAAAAAAGAQQAQQGSQSLARNLLAVAEADRQRIQAMLGRSFVAASSQDVLQPHEVVGGLRKPAPPPPAPPPAPLPVVEDRGGPSAVAPAPPTAAAAASLAGAAIQPGRIITAADLSRPLQEGAGGGCDKPRLPVRTNEEWRPAPLLCKRLNVPDPYHGRPAEMQMSRFKTDHLALPETAAALAGAVPAGAEQLLLPPGVQAALAAAQQQAAAYEAEQQQQQAAAVPEAPADAAGLADQFLSSLAADLMGGGPAGAAAVAAPGEPQQQPLPPGERPPLPAAEAGAAAEVAAAVTERPIDLFKAIFEDSDDEEEEEEAPREEQVVAAAKQPPGQEEQLSQAPGQGASGAPTAAGAAAVAAASAANGAAQEPLQAAATRREEDAVFGFAKLVGAGGGAAGAGPGAAQQAQQQQQAQQAPAIDDDTKRRVEEALRALRRQEKKEKRGKKEKKRKREDKKKKGTKERKRSKKERKEKGRKHHKSSGGSRRRREGSSGTDSDSSGSDSSSGSE